MQEGSEKGRKSNIRFKTNGIAKYYSNYRDKWEDFYPSEQWAFQKIVDLSPTHSYGTILDVGCALGGLGLALQGKSEEYVGVDINAQAIEFAKQVTSDRFHVPANFICEDIVQIDWKGKQFDNVFSLSCADWNIDTSGIIKACWERVMERGSFCTSVRLTASDGINDIRRSYQSIVATDEKATESANYVVFNWQELLKLFGALNPQPSHITGYGYYGKPSATAVTIYDELVFAVFIVKKGPLEKSRETQTELLLPLRLFTTSNPD